MHIQMHQLIAYRDRALEESERKVVEQHLAECDECRARYAAFEHLAVSLKSYFAAHRPAKTSDCPDASHWIQYLRGEMNTSDQARWKEHLQGCDYCFEVAASLKKEMLETSAEPLQLPEWMRQHTEGAEVSRQRSSLWDRWENFVFGLREVWASFASPPKWAYAVASLAVVLLVGWFVWQQLPSKESPQSPQSPPLAKLPGESVQLDEKGYQLLAPSKTGRPMSLPESSEKWQQWYNALTGEERPKTMVALLTPTCAQALETICQSPQGNGLKLLVAELEKQAITLPEPSVDIVLIEQTLTEQLIRGNYQPNQHLSIAFLPIDKNAPTAQTILKIESAR